MKDKPLNPVAVIPGGKVITPADAIDAILAYDAGCPECGRALVLCRGIGGPYFRHRTGEKHAS
jgi:hypothetical protein